MTVIIKAIDDPLFGERALQIHPSISPGADAAEREAQGWRRRSRYFSGRSLSDRALRTDQDHVQGAVVTTTQRLAPGIVAGLEAIVVGSRLDPLLHVAPGFGITLSGEDVRVPVPLELSARSLLVDDGAGELRSLAQIYDEDPTAAQAYVVLLQPVVLEKVGESDPDDPCEVDPEAIAFVDERLIDGCRVRLVPLPRDFELPSLDPEQPPRWRNVLIYALFEAEAALAPGEYPEYEHAGLPIGMLAFPPDDGEVFFDIHAVARSGGQAGSRAALIDGSGSFRLWQARFEQFITQLRELDSTALVADGLHTQFRWLPPVGMLPPGSVEVRGDRGEPDYPLPVPTVLPEHVIVEAVPVELEALDEFLVAGAFLDPIDLDALEQVQILVPVPQQHFDADLLTVEDETPDEFRETIELYLLRVNHRLGRRFWLRVQAHHLREHLYGERPTWAPDGDAVVGEVDSYFPVDAVMLERGEQLLEPDPDLVGDVTERLRQLFAAMLDAVGGGDDQSVANPLAILLASILREHGRPEADLVAPLVLNDVLRDQYLAFRFGGRGLAGFGAALARRLTSAAERLELTFTRVQAELHGLRTYLVGEDAANQMLSSPVVAAIAQRSVGPASSPTLSVFKQFILDLDPQLPAPRPDPDATRLTVPTSGIPTGGKQVSSSILFSQDLLTRLRQPVAVDAAESARRAKISALRTLLHIHEDLGLSLDGLEFPVLNRDGFVEPPLGEDQPITIAEIARAIQSWLEGMAWENYESIPLGGGSEATFFAASVASLEELVAALRIAEARLAAYEAVFELVSAEAAVLLRERLELVNRRLDALQDSIRELRHDIRVARALEREEVVRASQLNARRRQVIAEHVPFLVFRRPRTHDAIRSSPSVLLEPSAASDAVPECLEAEFEAPEQLRVMVDLVREMPLRWLSVGPGLAARVNRWSALRQLAELAWHRSRNPAPFDYQPFEGPAFSNRVGLRLRTLYLAQRSAFDTQRLAAGNWLGTNAYLGYAWQRLLELVQERATVNDLLTCPHGRQDVIQELSKELTDIYRVAACLYVRFREVEPFIRLGWVEQVSEEDDNPVALQDLSILPGWESVDRLDRRDMQSLVDWLLGRFVGERGSAREYALDLVRVALLLSGHAPVQQVVAAQVVNPRPVTRGGRVNLSLDRSRVRVGMHVQLYAGTAQAVAYGIIDDLADGVASVRVVDTDGGRAVSPVRAEVSEPSTAPRVRLGDGSITHVGVASSLARGRG